ncbi:molybdate ABC transporter substrate-binding protein [Frankia gtarii]|uniref:molybdate ABC transporter substrate-binding protein n=1 Tax=Frankia gtarii TaxID=2950102 RepID=UPI0021C1338D|nr:molybdate ABC transporter substrate-binding protein [Frankia gtarii]
MAAPSAMASMGGHGMSMPAASAAPGSIIVLAPGTLATALPLVDKAFLKAHPESPVSPNFGHSPAQVIQLQQGSPGDAFLAVGVESMTQAKNAGLLAGDPTVFAHNRLEIVVPAGNSKKITSLADLGKPGVTTILGDESTPVGLYAKQALAKAGVTVKPASKEEGSPSVVQRVVTGNADAGIAFATDLKGNSKVTGIDIPDAEQMPAAYSAAVLKGAKHADAAREFVSFLTTPSVQNQLRQLGFLIP